MTAIKRVTTDELLDLADVVTKLSGRAQQASQQTVTRALDALLAGIIDAAKSSALNEAMDRRKLAEMTRGSAPLQGTLPKEK